MIHMLDDPRSTTGDHRVGAVGITSHNDRVVGRRPDAGGLQCEARGLDVIAGTPGGWVKREVEATRGADGDVYNNTGATLGVG
jgi:hypothetical protein